MRKSREDYKKIAEARLGETRMMNCGQIAYIIEYNNANDIAVQFKDTNEVVKGTYGSFKNGRIKSHFSASVYGHGIVGLEPTVDENGNQLKSYKTWLNMLRRCYSVDFNNQYKYSNNYENCKVCDDWLIYGNFKKWYNENYYEVDNYTTALDKDILHKGNKVYSPENCLLVPQIINNLFTERRKKLDLPIGIKQIGNKFEPYAFKLNEDGKSKRFYIGIFDTIEEAELVYKKSKTEHIHNIANYYKKNIPSKVYEALINYTLN